MTAPDPTSAWNDAGLTAAGFAPGYWDRDGNPVPADRLASIDDIDKADREMAYFNDLVQHAYDTAMLEEEESINDIDPARRAAILDHTTMRAQILRTKHAVPDPPGTPAF